MPDMFLDLGFQILIIEIDENQHISYNELSENKRLMELYLDVGKRPMIFIRFNTDKYDNIKSHWLVNKISSIYIFPDGKQCKLIPTCNYQNLTKNCIVIVIKKII
jgi:hypothetical protein